MFGHKKQETPHFTPLTQQAGEEPVHIFDQTNGVLKRFEAMADAPADKNAAPDYEDTSRVVTNGVVGNAMLGGGPLGQ